MYQMRDLHLSLIYAVDDDYDDDDTTVVVELVRVLNALHVKWTLIETSLFISFPFFKSFFFLVLVVLRI